MAMWTLVPKPRSAIKTVEWFPSMGMVEGKDWNKHIGDIHPIRREYIKTAHPYDDYLGEDIEVHARMEFARYQTFGLAYLDKKNLIVITEAGKSLIREENKSELLLRQMLKWQFPSHIHRDHRYIDMRVFPLEIILKVINKYKELNKFQLAFSIFSCNRIEQIDETFRRIDVFKELTNDQPSNTHLNIYIDNFTKYNLGDGSPETYLDYIDVLFRHLEFTGIFETSGRGYFDKLYVPKRSQEKFSLLVNQYHFKFNENFQNSKLFYQEFGDAYFEKLPWDYEGPLLHLIRNKEDEISDYQIDIELPAINAYNYQQLKEYEAFLDGIILNHLEQKFIHIDSKTKITRDEILEKFTEIQEGNEDDAARWLEVNTWKSLIAINGTHFVKRNFKLNPDLTPRSFSPGGDNTPDMEFYNDEFILIPEVSVQSGVAQWVHEGSSVIDHVHKFMRVRDGEQLPGFLEISRFFNDKNAHNIFGLFICVRINERLLWQFYILCKESWLGQSVPVVPIEISVYKKLLEYIYEKDLPALEFEKLIEQIILKAKSSQNYHEWQSEKVKMIDSFVGLER